MRNSVAMAAIEKKLIQNSLTSLLEAFVICYSLGDRLNKLKKTAKHNDVLMAVDGVATNKLNLQISQVQDLSRQVAGALKVLFSNYL